MKLTKEEKALYEMYRRAYAASTPKGDFDELLANATINDKGEKVIPFNDYECEIETLQKIFDDVLKEYKIPKRRHKAFEWEFWLGCGPKSKITK